MGGIARSHLDAALWVEIQIISGCAHGAEPEELCIGRSPFVRVEISPIEDLELCAAIAVAATIDHGGTPYSTDRSTLYPSEM